MILCGDKIAFGLFGVMGVGYVAPCSLYEQMPFERARNAAPRLLGNQRSIGQVPSCQDHSLPGPGQSFELGPGLLMVGLLAFCQFAVARISVLERHATGLHRGTRLPFHCFIDQSLA